MSHADAFQPVMLICGDAPVLWRLSDGRLALALFTDNERATQYATEYCEQPFRVEAPSPEKTVRVIAACVRQEVTVAVLNPTGEAAGRVFDLKGMLRRVREQLRAGEPLEF